MMRSILMIAAIGLFASCNNEGEATTAGDTTTGDVPTAPVLLTNEEKNEGWISLFDGLTTKGWHKYGGAPVGSAWKVVDGMLYLDASQQEDWQIKGGGDIVTDEEYENFHFKVDWKIDTCGNSGVVFNINEDSAKYKWPWMTGPEVQILDNSCHPDAKIVKHRAGDLYDLVSAVPETVKPALEWNTAEIKSQNGTLEIYLNGSKVVTTTMWDEGWKKMIAGSKFKDMKDFGTYKKGRIGLQDHGNKVWFKNIKIRKL
jgi:Domain of Unknown Function (DUF1080)